MSTRHLACKIQAQAGAAGLARPRGIGAIERLADVRTLVGRNTRPMVAHAKLHLPVAPWMVSSTGPSAGVE